MRLPICRNTQDLDPRPIFGSQGRNGLLNLWRSNTQQFAGLAHQLGVWQISMPLVTGLRQGKQRPGLEPFWVIQPHPHRLGDLVGGLKTNPPHLAGEAIRLIFGDGNGGIAILLIQPHREAGANAVPLQKHHHLFNGLLLDPRIGNFDHPAAPNVRHLIQLLRRAF